MVLSSSFVKKNLEIKKKDQYESAFFASFQERKKKFKQFSFQIILYDKFKEN